VISHGLPSQWYPHRRLRRLHFDQHLTAGGNPLVSLKAVSGKYGVQKRYDAGAGLGGPISTSAISSTDFQIVAVRRNRTQTRFELWVNGVMEATERDTGAALTPDPIDIGRHATGTTAGLNGDIAELLIYRNELTDADFRAVVAYLEAEHGIETAFPGNLIATPLSPAAPPSYLRKSFTFPGNPARTTLRLSHTIADGAVFYLQRRRNPPQEHAGRSDHAHDRGFIDCGKPVGGLHPVPRGLARLAISS
jgi:Concanavalin A-like lectin/glucanases superfamily